MCLASLRLKLDSFDYIFDPKSSVGRVLSVWVYQTPQVFSCSYNAVLSGYITTLKNKQKLDFSSEGPSSKKGLRSKRRVSAYILR